MKPDFKQWDGQAVAGVYALKLGCDYIYIGQAVDIAARVKTHRSEMGELFDSVWFIEERDQRARLDMERLSIALCSPLRNGKRNGKTDLRPLTFRPEEDTAEMLQRATIAHADHGGVTLTFLVNACIRKCLASYADSGTLILDSALQQKVLGGTKP